MTSFIQISGEEDFKEIARMSEVIWKKHYIPIIGLAQVEYMLDKFLSKKALEDQIKEGYKYYFINFEGRKVGYVCIRKEDRALFLSKIYIYESYRGMKIGSSTLSFVYEQAKKLNCNIVYLTVNKNNSKSIAVYEKLGFKNVDSLVIDIGKGFVMNDYKMEKIL